MNTSPEWSVSPCRRQVKSSSLTPFAVNAQEEQLFPAVSCPGEIWVYYDHIFPVIL